MIEHRYEHLRCTDCGAQRTGKLPAEIAQSSYGPRLQAAVAALSVRNRVSRRDAVELCEELFDARACTGTIDQILARTGDALAQPDEDLLDRLRASCFLARCGEAPVNCRPVQVGRPDAGCSL